MTNKNLNIFKYKHLSESHLFLNIFWIMGRKHVFIEDWLFHWNFVLFFVSVYSVLQSLPSAMGYQAAALVCAKAFVNTSPVAIKFLVSH